MTVYVIGESRLEIFQDCSKIKVRTPTFFDWIFVKGWSGRDKSISIQWIQMSCTIPRRKRYVLNSIFCKTNVHKISAFMSISNAYVWAKWSSIGRWICNWAILSQFRLRNQSVIASNFDANEYEYHNICFQVIKFSFHVRQL